MKNFQNERVHIVLLVLTFVTISSLFGCRKAENILLKNENSWQLKGEIKAYQYGSLIQTKQFDYEIIFKNETSGVYRIYNSNNQFKDFTCKFYSAYLNKKLDMFIDELAPLGLYFVIDKVKKKKINLSATSTNALDFISSSFTLTTEKVSAEMIKL